MEELDRRAASGEQIDGTIVSEVFARYPKREGYPPYDPWTEAEAAALEDRYLDDLARIEADCPGVFLGSGAGSADDPAAGQTPAAQSGVSMYPAPRTVWR